MATSNTRRNDNARDDDLYTTPPWAIHAIIKREKLEGNICDAGYGTGNITKALVKHGIDRSQITGVDRNLHALDLDVLCDFNSYYPNELYQTVITNPPYKIFNDFVLKAIALSSQKVLVFARINALESAVRYERIYKKYPPARIYKFVNRVACPKGYDDKGGNAVMYCWIVWDNQHKGETITRWIEDHPKDYC